MTPLKSQLTFGTHFMALGHWMNGVAVVDCCGVSWDDGGGDGIGDEGGDTIADDDDDGGDATGNDAGDDGGDATGNDSGGTAEKLGNDGASFCFSGLLPLGMLTGRFSRY